MTHNPDNMDPRRIHHEDQLWAEANGHLDKVLDMVRDELPDIFETAGNTDESVIFSWLRYYIITAERQWGKIGHLTTILMCGAAITRLVRESERAKASGVLAQLERDMKDDDQH
jgi:hypothetical protein